MTRHLPVFLALALVGCSAWPAATGPAEGQLVVQNPLYGRFQTQLVPDGTRNLAILVMSRDRNGLLDKTELVTLDRTQRQTIIRGIPVGRAEVVVGAFNDTFDPIAANSSDVAIVPASTGQRTRLELTLSTDAEILRKLSSYLNHMKPTPSVSPSAPISADPSHATPPPGPQPSGNPPTNPPPPEQSPRPSDAPPPPPPSGNPLFDLGNTFNFQESFAGPELDTTRWMTRNGGTPTPGLTVANGLTVSIPPGASNVQGGIITAKMTYFDVQASVTFSVSSGTVGEGAQIGVFTSGASLCRSVSNGRPVYVLAGNGGANATTIPAPEAGGVDELRLVRQSGTFKGFAGSPGDLKPVGSLPAPFEAIPMELSVRTPDSGRTGLTVLFRNAAVALISSPAPTP